MGRRKWTVQFDWAGEENLPLLFGRLQAGPESIGPGMGNMRLADQKCPLLIPHMPHIECSGRKEVVPSQPLYMYVGNLEYLQKCRSPKSQRLLLISSPLPIGAVDSWY